MPYLRASRRMDQEPANATTSSSLTTAIVALCTAIATIPAAKIADRVGRKRVIYVALCSSAAWG